MREISNKIINETCRVANLSKKDVLGKSQKKGYSEARAIIAYELRSFDPLIFSLTEIGNIINRHHSTVCYALQCYRDWSEVDPVFKGKAEQVSNAIWRKTKAA